MTEQEQKQWYANRIPYAGDLAAYAMLIGQNNRVLQSVTYKSVEPTGDIIVPANPNRVAVVVGSSSHTHIGSGLVFRILRRGTTEILFNTDISRSRSDAVLGAHFGWHYTLILTVLTIGPCIQEDLRVLKGGTDFLATLVEVLMNPKCCDYLGGTK